MSDLLDVHLAHCRAAGFSDRTIGARADTFRRFARTLPGDLEATTTADVVAYLDNPDWAAWTRCTVFRHLRSAFKWAAEMGYIAADPTAKLRRPKNPDEEPNPVTDDELAHALEHSNDWWRRAILLAAFAGLRVSELTALLREDVTAERITIVRGKGGKTKSVPTHPQIWSHLQPLPPGLVLPNPHGGRVIDMPVKARRHFDKIGLPDVHLHRFRHRFACSLLEHGADIRTVQSLMRHSSLATTAKYLDIVDARRTAAVTALPMVGMAGGAR